MNTVFDRFHNDFVFKNFNDLLNGIPDIENSYGSSEFRVFLAKNSIIEHIMDKVVNKLCSGYNLVAANLQAFIHIIKVLNDCLFNLYIFVFLTFFGCEPWLNLFIIFQIVFHRFNLTYQWVQGVPQLMRDSTIDQSDELLFRFGLIIQDLIWHVYDL